MARSPSTPNLPPLPPVPPSNRSPGALVHAPYRGGPPVAHGAVAEEREDLMRAVRQQSELIAELQSQVEALSRGQNARESVTQLEIAKLKARDSQFSGEHRIALGGLQSLKTETKEARAADMATVAAAINNLLELSQETIARTSRTEQNVAKIIKTQSAALVQVTDDKGTSIRPASTVAAQSALRTEEKNALMKVDLDANAKKNVNTNKWTKGVALLAVLTPIILEIVKQLLAH